MTDATPTITTVSELPVEPSIFDLPAWTGAEVPAAPVEEHKFAGVRFQKVGKLYHYRADGFEDLKVGDAVIVETVRGKQMGTIATLKPPKDRSMGFRKIERKANGRDMAMRHYYENKELEAMVACRAESNDLGLPIKIVRAEYSYDGSTMTLLFAHLDDNHPMDVDIGALMERMSHLYRARIESRLVGPREVAKIIGGMGACGIEERCCSKFLTEFSPVTIKHAKEQNISLNPNDITGMCGRLRCCLVYEYEQYVEARRHLPKVKSMIGTPMGEGKVVELLALRDSVKVRFDTGEERKEAIFHREQLVPLEEYRRLQEKAAAGTCDRHEGGGCDCGRKGPKTPPANSGEVGAPPPAALDVRREEQRREERPPRRDERPPRREERPRREEPRREEPRFEEQRPHPEIDRPEARDLPPANVPLQSEGTGEIEEFNTGLGTAPRDLDRRDDRGPRRDDRGPRRDDRGPRRDDRGPRRDDRGPSAAPPPNAGPRRPLPPRRK